MWTFFLKLFFFCWCNNANSPLNKGFLIPYFSLQHHLALVPAYTCCVTFNPTKKTLKNLAHGAKLPYTLPFFDRPPYKSPPGLSLWALRVVFAFLLLLHLKVPSLHQLQECTSVVSENPHHIPHPSVSTNSSVRVCACVFSASCCALHCKSSTSKPSSELVISHQNIPTQRALWCRLAHQQVLWCDSVFQSTNAAREL